MKRAAHMVRAHGLRAVVARGLARFLRERERRLGPVHMRRGWRKALAAGRLERPVSLLRSARPLISIVVVVSDSVRNLAACLAALANHAQSSIPTDVLVVTDDSRGDVQRYLTKCSGVRSLAAPEGSTHIERANLGAAQVLASYTYFLDSATLVSGDAIASLLRLLESHPSTGAAKSKVWNLRGRLVEAGAVTFDDGSTEGYGEGADPSDASYGYVRALDACSTTSLLISTDALQQAGGLRADDALGTTMRARGFRILYQPQSAAARIESERSGTARRIAHPAALVEAAARRLQGPPIVVIDSFVAMGDRDAGSRRLLAIVRMMRELGYHVIFVPQDGGSHEPHTSELRQYGVEVRPHAGDLLAELSRLPVEPRIAWISRPQLALQCIPAMTARGIPTIYDTVDLHYVRLKRRSSYEAQIDWTSLRDMELRAARAATQTVVTSSTDRDVLGEEGIGATVLPVMEQLRLGTPPFEERSGLLFLGNYTHKPNVDAALRLCGDIMPHVWNALPDVVLTLAGFGPTREIQQLAGERVIVTGHVSDLRPLFDRARLSVAPLRFGAGLKGKVIQSLASGLPVVVSSIAAEGIGLVDGVNAYVADDAYEIARMIVELYQDRDRWNAFAAAGLETAGHFTPAAVRPVLAHLLATTVAAQGRAENP